MCRHAAHREAARSCYDEALALYRNADAPPTLDVANAVRPMAILEADLGNTGEALTLWREARDLYAAVDIAEGVEEAERWLERLS